MKNLEEVILILKTNGATQVDCVRALIEQLNLPLADADSIVLSSIAWKESKDSIIDLRNEFFDALEKE